MFIDLHRHLGVEPVLKALGASASAYYRRASGERSERDLEDERLTHLIRRVHRANYECYGYLRVWHELRRQGVDVGRDRVARLMRQAGLRGQCKPRLSACRSSGPQSCSAALRWAPDTKGPLRVVLTP